MSSYVSGEIYVRNGRLGYVYEDYNGELYFEEFSNLYPDYAVDRVHALELNSLTYMGRLQGSKFAPGMKL